jgi:homoserine kinase
MSDPLRPLHLRLPATSANLGAAFDAAAVALDFALEIDASPALEFSIHATGRNVAECSQLDRNLILETYRALLAREGRSAVPLDLRMNNQIPLGMGCGSSAAGRIAAVALAAHFGALGWSGSRVLSEAVALEGHPDNAAACWHGGLVVAATPNAIPAPDDPDLPFVSIPPPDCWRAILVLPSRPLATSHARSVLPDSWTRADVVANLQSAALLAPAFATGRADLLAAATRDRLHQPWRSAICPLLDPLLPLVGHHGIHSVTLSGAGPSVLLITQQDQASARSAITRALHTIELEPTRDFELLPAQLQPSGAGNDWQTR